jgi:hypothetical protein
VVFQLLRRGWHILQALQHTGANEMTNVYEFTTEAQCRAFWHHLVDQMGFERFCAQCSAKLENGVYKITVTH